MKQRVYVAGPMTGYRLHNFPAFRRAKAYLERAGYRVVSPVDLDKAIGVTEETSPVETFDQMRIMLRLDVMAILECDGIYMLKGWEKSVGARAEHALAQWLGIKIMYEVGA